MKKALITLSFLLLVFTITSCESNKKESEKGGPQNRMEKPEMDLQSVADKLGVTLEALESALGDMSQATPESLKNAAEILGVTEDELKDALGPPPGGPQNN